MLPAVSKQQQKFFSVVKAAQAGKATVTGKAKKAADTMSKDDVDDFASTKTKDLPKRAPKKEIINLLTKTIREGVMSYLEEGVDDPGILKMVHVAGGPGSGKSYTSGEIFGLQKLKGDKSELRTSFTDTGLKVVNTDTMFVHLLKKNGIDPKDMDWISKNDPTKWEKVGKLRGDAKGVINKMKTMFLNRRLGMIVDGTGHNFAKIAKQKKAADALGYDTYMIFVNTSLEVALERNRNRSRVVPEDVVKEMWQECQNNMGKFQSLFGSNNFSIIDNTVYGPPSKDVMRNAAKFVSQPITNRIGKKWIEFQRSFKKAGLRPDFDV